MDGSRVVCCRHAQDSRALRALGGPGLEDVGGSSEEAVEVDTSDIAFARRSLDTLEATRREYLITLRQQ